MTAPTAFKYTFYTGSMYFYESVINPIRRISNADRDVPAESNVAPLPPHSVCYGWDLGSVSLLSVSFLPAYF